jgi:hypothetical protein
LTGYLKTLWQAEIQEAAMIRFVGFVFTALNRMDRHWRGRAAPEISSRSSGARA